MEILKTIPEKVNVGHIVNIVTINITEKTAYVNIELINEGPAHIVARVDLTPIMAAATATQRTVIRGFIKEIIAQALAISISSIPEVLE